MNLGGAEWLKFLRRVAPPMVDWLALLPVFVSLFAIVNPTGVLPVYLAFTRGMTEAERRRVAWKAVLVACGVLLFFGLAGDAIFRTFGITIPAFRVAGGILIFKYAYDMLHGERPGIDATEEEIASVEARRDDPAARARRESVAITPLGVPLLTGPGAIATMMVYLAGAPDVAFRAAIFGAAILVFALSFGMLLAASRLGRALGPSGMMIVIRLMGLILAAVAVQFVATGTMQLVDTFLDARDAGAL